MDNRLLEVLLAVQFGGRPVGLTTLASALAEDPDTVEDVYEPFLMQQGLMMCAPLRAVRPPPALGSIWASCRRRDASRS